MALFDLDQDTPKSSPTKKEHHELLPVVTWPYGTWQIQRAVGAKKERHLQETEKVIAAQPSVTLLQQKGTAVRARKERIGSPQLSPIDCAVECRVALENVLTSTRESLGPDHTSRALNLLEGASNLQRQDHKIWQDEVQQNGTEQAGAANLTYGVVFSEIWVSLKDMCADMG